MMLDREKKVHRPERLKGYDYSSPGCYFVTFNTKARGEPILCNLETAGEAEASLVGPDPLVRPFHQGLPFCRQNSAQLRSKPRYRVPWKVRVPRSPSASIPYSGPLTASSIRSPLSTWKVA